MSKVSTMSQLLEMIERGEDIPFALRNSANHYGINIEQLKEILRDVNEKEAKHINSESSETGVSDPEDDWLCYPEAYTGCVCLPAKDD